MKLTSRASFSQVSSADLSMAPLRVLCIHGYRQNATSFREKTGALRKLLKKHVELVYVSAPLSVQQVNTEGGSPTPVAKPIANCVLIELNNY